MLFHLALPQVFRAEPPLQVAPSLAPRQDHVPLIDAEVRAPRTLRLVRSGGRVRQRTIVALPAALDAPMVVVPLQQHVRVCITIVLALRLVIIGWGVGGVVVVGIFEIAVGAVVVEAQKQAAAAKRRVPGQAGPCPSPGARPEREGPLFVRLLWLRPLSLLLL